jgi:hypothetical protein
MPEGIMSVVPVVVAHNLSTFSSSFLASSHQCWPYAMRLMPTREGFECHACHFYPRRPVLAILDNLSWRTALDAHMKSAVRTFLWHNTQKERFLEKVAALAVSLRTAENET